MLSRLTPEKTEKLATAYERGDGKTVGRILGEQFANLPIAGGGLGTIKVVGKGLDAASDAGKLAGKTNTSPIDMNHVIGGDYNRKLDKVTGGHSLLNNDVRIIEIISPPDIHGVYTAKIEIKNPDGRWVEKDSGKNGNTMFPQHWSAEKIMDEIDSAWKKRKIYKDNRQLIGESKSGVIIRGYLSPRKTAFPEYKIKDK